MHLAPIAKCRLHVVLSSLLKSHQPRHHALVTEAMREAAGLKWGEEVVQAPVTCPRLHHSMQARACHPDSMVRLLTYILSRKELVRYFIYLY